MNRRIGPEEWEKFAGVYAPNLARVMLRRRLLRTAYWLAIWAIGIAFVLLLSLDGWS